MHLSWEFLVLKALFPLSLQLRFWFTKMTKREKTNNPKKKKKILKIVSSVSAMVLRYPLEVPASTIEQHWTFILKKIKTMCFSKSVKAYFQYTENSQNNRASCPACFRCFPALTHQNQMNNGSLSGFSRARWWADHLNQVLEQQNI